MSDRVDFPLNGQLELRVWRDGRLWIHELMDNLVVDGAKDVISKLLGGTLNKEVTQFGVGEDGTAPAPGDTALTNAFIVPVVQTTFPAAGHVAFDWEIGTAQANGLEIIEFGLFTASNDLVSRKVRGTPISKTDQVSLAGTWELFS